ncbi:hypothetical protein LTR12_016830 [Friedmanniomyces endolithicus]|nr:hypothetical protein LTR12_016830 [Friedmanniomyces endolithicus]
MIHTEYGKQQQQQGLYQNNVRLLTQPVGTLLLDYLVFVRPLYERFLRQSSPQALISPFLWEKNGKVWSEGRLSRCLEGACVRAQVPRLHTSNWRQITVAIVKTKFAADALCFDLEDVDEDGEEIEADIKIMTEQRNHKTRTVNRAYANSTPSSATFANVYDGLVRKGLRASQLWQAFWGFDILFANRWIHILRTDRLDLFVQPISTCAADSACNATRRSVRKLRRVDASVHVPGKQTSRRRDRESHPTMDLIKYYSEYRVLCCRVCQIGLHPNHYAQHFYKFYVRAAPELASSPSIHHFVNNVLLPLLPVSPIQPQTELSHYLNAEQTVRLDAALSLAEGHIAHPDSTTELLDRKCLDLCVSLLDQRLTGNVYESTLVGFFAILGIDEANDTFLDAVKYTPRLSAFVKIAQLLVLRKAVVEVEAGSAADPLEALDAMRLRFMTLNNPTPFTWALQLRAFGKQIRDSTTSMGLRPLVGRRGDTELLQGKDVNGRLSAARPPASLESAQTARPALASWS